MSDAPLTVLVPDDGYGERFLAESASLTPVVYTPGDDWPADHRDATALVVGLDAVEEVTQRLGDLPELRLVQNLTAGYEQWLPALPDGVALSNARGAHGGSSAEWVVAVLLATVRELRRFDATQREGRWAPATTRTLDGATVVVLGAGDLARNLADRLEPFGVQVQLVGRTARENVTALDDVAELLPGADAVVSMLPDSDATHHVIDADFLAALPDGAVVINVGRGGAVDQDALIAELSSGRLSAALDVTDPEPLPDGHPLWSTPNLILTPHVGGDTEGSAERAWSVARRQLEAFAAGDEPPNLVAGPGADGS